MMAEAKPMRIQRRRAKGWKMPANTVYVGRGSKWGNPFICDDPEAAVAAYSRCWSNWDGLEMGEPNDGARMVEMSGRGHTHKRQFALIEKRWDELELADLRGKNLACWCPLDKPCHADFLLEIANR